MAKHDKFQLLLESLLLHEAVHWARSQHNLPATITLRDRLGNRVQAEAGKCFERKAYGKDINIAHSSLLFKKTLSASRKQLGIADITTPPDGYPR